MQMVIAADFPPPGQRGLQTNTVARLASIFLD